MVTNHQWQTFISRLLFVAGTVIAFAVCAVPDVSGQVLPSLPQNFVDTSYPALTGTTISVPAGGNFQSALDQAQLGDTIQLQAGATFTGNYRLRTKTGTGWIIIRTSAADSSLPPQGRRITPSYASVLPKIVSPSSLPALQTDAGAHHYRLVGLEITVAASASINYGLVVLNPESMTSMSQVPSHIILDRVYIHGLPNNNLRRGVALNSATTAIIDSYISDVHEIGADSQAICGWAGPGPYKIVNNFLEAAAENILFGGADPDIVNLVPSDIEVRGNHLFKPLKWKIGHPSYAGKAWQVKNLFELKNSRRVLVDSNIMENNWLHAQNGFAVLFTPRNQDGSAPWSGIQDVTFTNNIVRHTGSAMNMIGFDSNFPSQQTKRVLIRNNLYDDVSSGTWGGSGRLFQALDELADMTIDHNTAFHTGDVITAEGGPSPGFTYRNNLSPNNEYGVGGAGTYGNPNATLNTYFPGSVFRRNILQGGNAGVYPPDNFFPATMANVGFVDFAGKDYRLVATSPYKNAGTDGKDVGADIDAINAKTAGVINGTAPGDPPPPPPPDTTPPSVNITAPPDGATVSGTTTITANASDNAGVVGVQFYVDGLIQGAEDTTAPYSTSWNTTQTSNGTHTLTAKARDAAANNTTSAPITVTVDNAPPPPPPDTTPPSVNITAPLDGAMVSATTFITANATDNVGVAGVQFYVDGLKQGAEDTTAPYSTSWNTTTVADGPHTLTAIARDAAANNKTSDPVDVTVDNTPDPPETQSPYKGAPSEVPGQFEGEDFDKGGEGVAYHDLVAGNSGGLYRPGEDVDIISPYANGHVVNNFQASEWLEYTIDVTQAGTYRLEALVSSAFTTSKFHVEVDGTDVTGVINVPSTGAWSAFQWVGKDGVTLTAGQHVLRMFADAQYFNLDAIRVLATQTPYPPSPAAAPGQFAAEDFDKGGEGIAYHDLVAANAGGLYRPNEDVDIMSPYANGYVVNNFQTGEWLEYTINVTQAGTYKFEALVSSTFTTSKFHMEVDGTDVTGLINVPSTGGWGVFQWVGKTGVSLTAGQHVLRIFADAQYFNVDAIRIIQ